MLFLRASLLQLLYALLRTEALNARMWPIPNHWSGSSSSSSSKTKKKHHRVVCHGHHPEDEDKLCEWPYIPPKSDNTLPNVLIAGDSIASRILGYYNETAAQLLGIANVINWNFGHGTNSFKVVECLENRTFPKTISSIRFDVISFNYGFHDIAPNTYCEVGMEEHVHNMRQAIHMLKDHLRPNGKLIFQTTTPVPPNTDPILDRNNTAVVMLNERIKQELSKTARYPFVELNDLNKYVIRMCRKEYHKKCYPDCPCPAHRNEEDIHFSPTANKEISEQIAGKIVSALGISE